VDLPCIKNTIVIMFIMNIGFVMSLGFEKAFLMQNPLNLQAAEIMSTYVYKMGLINSDFSYSTAFDVVNSIINIVLILTFNPSPRLKTRKGVCGDALQTKELLTDRVFSVMVNSFCSSVVIVLYPCLHRSVFRSANPRQ
jgi:hypothetical protein